MNKKNSISSGIITVLFANLCNLGFSILTSFLLPKFLSLDTYAGIKTFQFYIGYVGILHLGYVDGMYIRNGGRELQSLDSKELAASISTLRTMEFFIAVVLLVILFFYHDKTFLAFVLVILPLNMTAYFQYLFSAVGEFSKYSLLIRGTTIATFGVNMFLLFVIKTDVLALYLVAYVLIDYIIWIILEIEMSKVCKLRYNLCLFDFFQLKENVKNGILLTLGNLSSYLFTGLDRWFVKILLLTTDFAQYSFAVSIEHFVDVTMTPVSITLYNYFCKNKKKIEIKQIRSYVTIFGVFIISVAFPAKFILEHFLVKYIAAIDIIFYLFSAQIFYFPIKCVYVNLYKSQKKQRLYFTKLIFAIIMGFVLNVVCFAIMRNKEAMAVATVLSTIFWWILCILDFKEVAYKTNDIVFIIVELVAFNVCGIAFSSIAGGIIYMLFSFAATAVFERKDFIEMIKRLRDTLKCM